MCNASKQKNNLCATHLNKELIKSEQRIGLCDCFFGVGGWEGNRKNQCIYMRLKPTLTKHSLVSRGENLILVPKSNERHFSY
jgi:hypothetical protein